MTPITIKQACALYRGADATHDFDHVLRVLALAERLAEEEGADLDILRTAVLLHDVARSEERSDYGLEIDAEIDHAILGARMARVILADQPPDFVDAVAHAIEAHRYRNAIEPRTIEAKVLFDADKLDSIGAVGVARAFAFGGAMGQPLWGDVSVDYVPGGDEAHTPHHEFHLKLKHIKDRLYTSTGKRIAEARHQVMAAFYEQMAAEVRGER